MGAMAETGLESERGPHLLVVDDELFVRKIVGNAVEKLHPSSVTVVENGVEAQAVLRTQPVDIVVTDVLMPNMSGIELMRWAHHHAPDSKWIVLSQLDTFEAAVEALQAGAFDYLAKPPDVTRVQIAVQHAWENIIMDRNRQQLRMQLSQSLNRQNRQSVALWSLVVAVCVALVAFLAWS